MMVAIVVLACCVAVALSATVGYCVGRRDGEDEVARHYEAKRRKWASNEREAK